MQIGFSERRLETHEAAAPQESARALLRSEAPREELALRLHSRLALSLALATPLASVAAEPWRFDWGGACRVPVTEQVERKGQKATASFVLDLQKKAEGFELRFTDYRMLALEGLDPDDPRTTAVLEQVGRQASLIPVTRVDSEGRYAGITGLDEMIEGVLDLQAKGDPELAARMRQAMTSPQLKAQLEEKMGDYWRSWVEAWLGADLAPSETREKNLEIQVPGGTWPLEVRVEHRGPSEGAPNLARLVMLNRTGGDDLQKMTAELLGGVDPEEAAKMRELDMQFDKVTSIEADLELSGLRPHHVRYVSEIEVRGGGEVHSRRDVRDDTFHWERAEGCRR